MSAKQPLLVLGLLVKNEAHTIQKTLDSCADVVDFIVVYDTGSTDGTQTVISNWRKEEYRCRSVYLQEGEFGDYASARNKVLDIAKQNYSHAFQFVASSLRDIRTCALYTLSLSADEVLVGGEHLRDFFVNYDGDEKAFLIEVRATGGLFDYPRILRIDNEDKDFAWRYEGEVHEMPKCQTDPERQPKIKIPGCWIEYKPTDPVRHATRLKEYDLPALARMQREATTESDWVRCLLLFAQTHEAIASILIANKANGIIREVESEAVAHQAQALGYYLYVGQKSNDANVKFKFLNVADTLGLYSSKEMLERLRVVDEAHPGDPAVAFMMAVHTANIDARAGLSAARRAAKMAEAAVVDKNNPFDPHGLLWRPHFIAALCAKALGDSEAMEKHVAQGMTRAPAEAFKEFLQ